ncbi:uncharacterized protein LOC126336208 [Schistocerca gregaria]|uniref:uncharacterized protein LOC126336208 n=1 Tax=Schistocerca gregaria TaxID=7010 RepID=UPI00211DC46B|nr:uncharacterized protein LOC126336208 [Schistocerca gregaria]
MKLGLLLVATLAAVVCSAARAGHLPTTTETPCPRRCIAGQPSVCAEVSPGRYITYSGACMKSMCECMLNRSLTQVDMSLCRDALRDKCPLRVVAVQTPVDAEDEEDSLST